jgi:hypothetical protein
MFSCLSSATQWMTAVSVILTPRSYVIAADRTDCLVIRLLTVLDTNQQQERQTTRRHKKQTTQLFSISIHFLFFSGRRSFPLSGLVLEGESEPSSFDKRFFPVSRAFFSCLLRRRFDVLVGKGCAFLGCFTRRGGEARGAALASLGEGEATSAVSDGGSSEVRSLPLNL